ncbi:MAG: hypothetical protein ACM37W_19805 [Actinomycetota bacterium]
MEEWQKSFFQAVEIAVSEVDRFFNEMSEEFTEVFDAIAKLSDEISQEVQTNLLNELEQCFTEFIEPIVDIYLDLDGQVDEIDPSFIGYVHPTQTEHSACQGCRHYHGQVYGGNLLVCGMHPYGVESENCADWESFEES